MCYEHMVCEDECCHDLEFGIPYCCSRYTGFIYLGLMIGGGVIIAMLVIACYVFMRRTERELEAAAKLEAAKALNNAGNRSILDTSSTNESNSENVRTQTPEANPSPPAYHDVMRTFTRCHSCDIPITASAHSVEIMNSLVRQYSQGNHAPLTGLPVLVDIQELIARHRREHGRLGQVTETGLPPISSQDPLDNKLPTYEECISGNMAAAGRSRDLSRSNELERNDKSICQVLSTLGSSFDYSCPGETRCSVGHRHKLLGESNVYFENVSETFHNHSHDIGTANRPTHGHSREGIETVEAKEATGNTERREWLQKTEPVDGNVSQDGRAFMEAGEATQVIINANARDLLQEMEHREILANTEIRKWQQETEIDVIVNAVRRIQIEETEPNESTVETETSAESRISRDGILHLKARDRVKNMKVENVTELGLNRATFMKASEELRNEIKHQAEDNDITEETADRRTRTEDAEKRHGIKNFNVIESVIADTEGSIEVQSSEITQVLEAGEKQKHVSNTDMRQAVGGTQVRDDLKHTDIEHNPDKRQALGGTHVREDLKHIDIEHNPDTRQAVGGTQGREDLKHTNIAHYTETKQAVNGTQIRDEMKHTDVQHDTEDTQIERCRISTDKTEGRSEIHVWSLPAQGVTVEKRSEDIIGNIRSGEIIQIKINNNTANKNNGPEIFGSEFAEVISENRGDRHHGETRGVTVDVTIREDRIDTEKREGIGDTVTNMETIKLVSFVEITDTKENTCFTDSKSETEVRNRETDTDIEETEHSVDKQGMTLTECTKGEELVNNSEVKQSKLQTKVKWDTKYTGSEGQMSLPENVTCTTDLTRDEGLFGDKGGQEVGEATTAEEDTNQGQRNNRLFKERWKDATRISHGGDNDATDRVKNVTSEDHTIWNVVKQMKASPEDSTNVIAGSQGILTSVTSCDVFDASLPANEGPSSQQDETNKS